MLVRDQEVGGSNPLAPTNLFKHLQTLTTTSGSKKGPVLDPTLTRMVDSASRYRRVLTDLPPDDIDGPLGRDQEVW